MSELNISISSLGARGLEKDNSLDKENAIKYSVEANVVVPLQENKELKDKTSIEKEKPLTSSEITETVEEMNSLLANMKRNLSFSVDEQSGQRVIIVKDSENDEMIRQIPSEELLVLRKKMDDVVGILFDIKV